MCMLLCCECMSVFVRVRRRQFTNVSFYVFLLFVWELMACQSPTANLAWSFNIQETSLLTHTARSNSLCVLILAEWCLMWKKGHFVRLQIFTGRSTMPSGRGVMQLDHCAVLAILPLRLLSTYTISLQTQAGKVIHSQRELRMVATLCASVWLVCIYCCYLSSISESPARFICI